MTKHYVYPDDKPDSKLKIVRWVSSSTKAPGIWFFEETDNLAHGDIWTYPLCDPSPELQARSVLLRKRDGR